MKKNIKWPQSNFKEFLKDFCNRSDAEDIYFIANNMGNRVSTRAHISLINENPHLRSRFTKIILAAPDIDANVFKREIAPEMVQAYSPVTLYTSSKYFALKHLKQLMMATQDLEIRENI